MGVSNGSHLDGRYDEIRLGLDNGREDVLWEELTPISTPFMRRTACCGCYPWASFLVHPLTRGTVRIRCTVWLGDVRLSVPPPRNLLVSLK